MATCTEAPACRAALTQATELWPDRNKASDGICGDAAHQASISDHNPNPDGFATAFDITHDPDNGVHNNLLSEMIKNRPDIRIKYIIWNRRIWNPSISDQWRLYNGPDPHTSHMHVSILDADVHKVDQWWAPTIVEEKGLIAITVPRAQGGFLVLQLNDGGVFAFDGAPFLGSMQSASLGFIGGLPVVGADWTPGGQGYWLLGTDGGVFAFGNAPFHGGFNTLPVEVQGQRIPTGIVARGDGYRIMAFDPSNDSTRYDHFDFGQ